MNWVYLLHAVIYAQERQYIVHTNETKQKRKTISMTKV